MSNATTMSSRGQARRSAGRRPGAPPSLMAAAIPAAIGMLLLVLGWMSVSGEAAFDDQQVGLNIGILGGIVVLAGCAFYLWVYRRRIHRRVKALRLAVLGDGDDFAGGAA
jgi:hypothetical protein